MNRALSSGIDLSTVERISVPFLYSVVFTKEVFSPENRILANTLRDASETPRFCIWMDAGLVAAQPELPGQADAYCDRYLAGLAVGSVKTFPGGEQVKDGWQHVNAMIADLMEAKLCRHSYVIAVGGGAFLDAAGFAAALVHRGVRLIRLPSTTLSQDDSGVGVKNGINLHAGKNFLGTFAPPYAVINDLHLLRTLPPDLVADGTAEAFKVAIIKDVPFFDFLCENAEALRECRPNAIHEMVQRCARLHLDHIISNGDPFEMGDARPLDFGHWAAHRLESISRYQLRHGQAVAIGIALDSHYACGIGLLSSLERDRILSAFLRAGLPIWHPLLNARAADGHRLVLDGIEQFREHLGGELAVTMPDGLGNRIEVGKLDTALLERGIAELEMWDEAGVR